MNADLEKICQDWRDIGVDEDSIRRRAEMLMQSMAFNPGWMLKERIEKIIDGRLNVIEWPWKGMSNYFPCLTSGSLTVLAGAPGATKSYLLLQAVTYWVSNGVKVAMMAMEGPKGHHLQRMLAQLDGTPSLTDMNWIVENPELASGAMDRHMDHVDKVGHSIFTPENSGFTYTDALEWIRKMARAKTRIIIVDPITAADPQDAQWEADRYLINTSHEIAIEHNVSVILISHPSKNMGNKPSLDSLAGGTAYQRHVDYVAWLAAIDPEKMTVAGPCGRHEIECNRLMHLLKVRDGRGQGKTIAFNFGAHDLLLAEQGVVIKEKKG